MTADLSITPHDPSVAWRERTATLALVATFAAILMQFLLSAITLESLGVPYVTSGGGLFSKLHPGTFVAVAAVVLRCLTTRHPVRTGWRLVTSDTGIVLLTGATLVAAMIGAGVAKMPVTPLVDTFLFPIMVVLLLRDLDPVLLRWMAIAIGLILVANAIIAILEFLGGWHVVHVEVPAGASSDPTRSGTVFSWQAELVREWRATALLGHPLVNGSIIGAFLLCLAAPGSRWIPVGISIPLGGLQLASMFAFGARTALVFTIVLGTILMLQRTVAGLARGVRLQPRIVAIGLLGVALTIAGIGILIEINFFDKMIDRFSQDQGSAETRLTMLELFTSIPLSDLFLVPDQDLVATLQRVYGLEFGIESSWIGLALNYGLIVTAGLMVGLLAFSRSVIRACGDGAAMVLVFFMILASVAATLSTKTTSFGMIVCLILVFLPREGRPYRPHATTSRSPI